MGYATCEEMRPVIIHGTKKERRRLWNEYTLRHKPSEEEDFELDEEKGCWVSIVKYDKGTILG